MAYKRKTDQPKKDHYSDTAKEMPNEPDHPHVHLLIKTGVMGDLLSNFEIFGVAIELSLCFDVKMFYILLITEAKERSL